MFLSPWMLYGLGALTVPILIHLWQRRRVVQVPFSTLRYLKIVAARTSRTSKVENLLLLLLRCFLFALLIVATARPIILARTAKLFGGDVPRTVVLVIDNSASMAWQNKAQGEKTRLDLASGGRVPVRSFSPPDPAGHLQIRSVFMTPDARTIAYTYDRRLSELFLVEGLAR